MNGGDAAEAAIRQLRERIAELQSQSTASGSLADRLVDWVGDACTIAALILLFIFPVDSLSLGLAVLGIAILGYNHLIRAPRLKAREEERRRQIDMLKARVDQMERELVGPTPGFQ